MRQETQQRDRIRFTVEVTKNGVGRTGLVPTVLIKRILDGLYWNGSSWQVGATTVNMGEVDATNEPGKYLYALPSDGIDSVLGADGYVGHIRETTYDLRENVEIDLVDIVPETALPSEEGTASVTQLDAHAKVQLGVSHQVNLALQTSAPVNGKAGAFTLESAKLTVGATVNDLVVDGLTMPEMIELGRATPGGGSAATTGTPTFVAGGGPSSEDVYSIPVDNSAVFSVGEFLRGRDKPAGQGHVHEILDIPSGTEIVVHASSVNFDIVNGDTVEQVDPSGIYVGFFDLDVDAYISASDPSGQLEVVVSTVTTGDAPKFTNDTQLIWRRAIELDLSGRGFRTG